MSQGSAQQKIGFIGWSRESAAVLSALRSRTGEAQHMPWLPLAPARKDAATPQHAGLPELPSVEAIFQACDLLFVAPPPKALSEALPLMRLSISDRHTVVLLGAGWRLDHMLHHLQERKLVRCNLTEFPATGAILMTYHTSPYLSPTDRSQLEGLFSHLELALDIPQEAQFDAALGLTGFAPAAFYTLMEALADAALVAGLPRSEARRLIASMLNHTAAGLLQGETHPAALREEALTDPAAAAALQELEIAGVRGVMMRALEKGLQEQARHRNRSTQTPD